MSKKKEARAKGEKIQSDPVIELFNRTRGKYKSVLIAGINQDGKIDLDTTFGNFPAIQWLLSRLAFDVHVMEKSQENTKEPVVQV